MRKLIALVILSLFTWGVVAKTTIAGDIYGYVHDTNGKGLPGVEISSKDDYKVCSEKTSGSGSYYLSLSAGSYTIKYEKEGYQTQNSTINLSKNEIKNIEIVVMIANAVPVN